MEVVTFSIMAHGRWCQLLQTLDHLQVQGLQQLTQHWRNGSNMCIWSLLRWIITTWGTEMSPFQNYNVGLTQSSLCPQIFSFFLLCGPAFPTFLPHFFHQCACVWLIVPGKAVTGCWLRSVNLATLFSSASDRKRGDITQPWLPQLGQSGVSACGWISACLPPCAAPWHRSPYGSYYVLSISWSLVCVLVLIMKVTLWV